MDIDEDDDSIAEGGQQVEQQAEESSRMEVLGCKRPLSTEDPDYTRPPDAKRLKRLQNRAQEELAERVVKVVERELSEAMVEKQAEMEEIDQRILRLQQCLHTLRYCVSLNYYASTKVGSEGGTERKAVMHPTVRQHLHRKSHSQETSETRLSRDDQGGNSSPLTKAAPSSLQNSPHKSPAARGNTATLMTTSHCSGLLDSPMVNLETPDDSSNSKDDSNQAPDECSRPPAESTMSPADSSSVLTCTRPPSPKYLPPKPPDNTPSIPQGRRQHSQSKRRVIVGNTYQYLTMGEAGERMRYKWQVYVRTPPEDPPASSFITAVTFLLDHSYAPHHLITLRQPPFVLSRRGWGEFKIQITLELKDQRNKPVRLLHPLVLSRPDDPLALTGLWRLGQENWYDLWVYLPGPESSKTGDVMEEEDNCPASLSQELDKGVVSSKVEGHVTVLHQPSQDTLLDTHPHLQSQPTCQSDLKKVTFGEGIKLTVSKSNTGKEDKSVVKQQLVMLSGIPSQKATKSLNSGQNERQEEEKEMETEEMRKEEEEKRICGVKDRDKSEAGGVSGVKAGQSSSSNVNGCGVNGFGINKVCRIQVRQADGRLLPFLIPAHMYSLALRIARGSAGKKQEGQSTSEEGQAAKVVTQKQQGKSSTQQLPTEKEREGSTVVRCVEKGGIKEESVTKGAGGHSSTTMSSGSTTNTMSSGSTTNTMSSSTTTTTTSSSSTATTISSSTTTTSSGNTATTISSSTTTVSSSNTTTTISSSTTTVSSSTPTTTTIFSSSSNIRTLLEEASKQGQVRMVKAGSESQQVIVRAGGVQQSVALVQQLLDKQKQVLREAARGQQQLTSTNSATTPKTNIQLMPMKFVKQFPAKGIKPVKFVSQKPITAANIKFVTNNGQLISAGKLLNQCKVGPTTTTTTSSAVVTQSRKVVGGVGLLQLLTNRTKMAVKQVSPLKLGSTFQVRPLVVQGSAVSLLRGDTPNITHLKTPTLTPTMLVTPTVAGVSTIAAKATTSVVMSMADSGKTTAAVKQGEVQQQKQGEVQQQKQGEVQQQKQGEVQQQKQGEVQQQKQGEVQQQKQGEVHQQKQQDQKEDAEDALLLWEDKLSQVSETCGKSRSVAVCVSMWLKALPLVVPPGQPPPPRSILPFCTATSDQHFLQWPLPKQRAAEFQRAREVVRRLGGCGAGGVERWDVVRVVAWARRHAHTPTSTRPLLRTDQLLSLPPCPRVPAATLSVLDEMGQGPGASPVPPHTSPVPHVDVDVVGVETKEQSRSSHHASPEKQRVGVDSMVWGSGCEPAESEWVGQMASQLRLQLKPEVLDTGYQAHAAAATLWKGMLCLMEDLLRGAHCHAWEDDENEGDDDATAPPLPSSSSSSSSSSSFPSQVPPRSISLHHVLATLASRSEFDLFTDCDLGTPSEELV